MNAPSVPPVARKPLLDARGRLYEPAVGPRLRVLLFLIFVATALLGISGVYLLAIRLLEAWRGPEAPPVTNPFALWMFLGHLAVGLGIAAPFLVFGITHYRSARRRKNRLAVRLGIALFLTGTAVVFSGLALFQLQGLPQLSTGSAARWVVYGLHVAAPVAAVALYVLHRWAGPDIQWRWAGAWGAAVAASVGGMVVLHLQDPRGWYAQGPREGERYFEPSAARTATGNFIPASALMMDEYCKRCHEDIYNDHFHSAHHFSSFNNPPYRFSVRESRQIRDEQGIPRASRWCAGCHDPVPFFSGAFDDPNFDDENHPTAHAGITCTVCHAINHVNSAKGNADYTIEEPQHYPFATSQNPFLQWVNNQLVKARPAFHKKTFLKPFHRTAEFCSTCHKVSLPVELNHYKEFLRGQNHYDSYLLSGVSGGNARSFYYPPEAKTNCAACHMPARDSRDFGNRDGKVHHHLFPGGNTGLPWLLALEPRHAAAAEALRAASRAQADFLTGTDPAGKDRPLRIDLFALREGDGLAGKLLGPIRPQLPVLQPGRTYLVEVVIRTLTLGHPFTQGTVDSNEIWVDFTARAGGRILGRSGALAGPDDSGPLDEWAHRINVLMLDRKANRINRRNPQDIFTPLYNHQIPPGAGQVVHYRLAVPPDLKEPVELSVRLRYRKFDFEYLSLVYGGDGKVPRLPVIDLCADRVILPVAGVDGQVPAQQSPIQPAWQRWNDYGIGLLLAALSDPRKPGLRQAEEAFTALTRQEAPAALAHGHLNRARVFVADGRLDEAARALQAARDARPAAPWWTLAWFSGLVKVETARDRSDFDAAIADFESIVDPKNQPSERQLDFTRDYVVLDKLGQTLFKRALFESRDHSRRDPYLLRAVERYRQTLRLDPEDLDAHYGLHQCFRLLGQAVRLPAPDGTPGTDEATLQTLGETLRNGQEAKEARLAAAARLTRALVALGQEEVSARAPKRGRLDRLLARLGPTFAAETDPDIRAATAAVLGELHRELHAIFKPDNLAQSNVIGKYRAAHPAADRAAEAIVIYDLRNKD